MKISPQERQQIVEQIGAHIWAISGGRVVAIDGGVELPAGSGYRVRVVLDPSDTYTVTRVFIRGGREFAKGDRTNVYCDEVGNVAYLRQLLPQLRRKRLADQSMSQDRRTRWRSNQRIRN